MAFDGYLMIEGLKGDSVDSKFKDQIAVLSYSHGISQKISGRYDAQGVAVLERCDHSPFVIVKELDSSSPGIAFMCSAGKPVKEVLLTLNRATGDKSTYLEIKLENAVIISVNPGGSKEGNTLPLEEVSFMYKKITWKYTKYSADGQVSNTTAWWDAPEGHGGQ